MRNNIYWNVVKITIHFNILAQRSFCRGPRWFKLRNAITWMSSLNFPTKMRSLGSKDHSCFLSFLNGKQKNTTRHKSQNERLTFEPRYSEPVRIGLIKSLPNNMLKLYFQKRTLKLQVDLMVLLREQCSILEIWLKLCLIN